MIRSIQHLLTITLILCAALACQRELLVEHDQAQQSEEWPLTFQARAAGDEQATKTVLDADGSSVLWGIRDRINVFYGTLYSGRFTSTNEEAASIAEFKGSLQTIVGAVENGFSSKKFMAVYPFSSKNTSDGSHVFATMPDVQTAVAGSFDSKALLTFAESETLELAFYNVCGGIKFTVKESGIQQVVLQGNNNEALAGEAVIHMNAEKRPEVTEVKNPKTSIKLTAPKGESFVPGEWYYLVSLPVELTQGFRLTLLSESKTGIYEHSTPVTVERALFGTLTEVDADVAYEVADNRIYPGPRNNEIWYTTTDELPCGPGSPGYEVLSSGESFLSVLDLFGADIVSNTYENGQGVMTFAGPVRFVKGIPDMGSPFYAVSSGGGYNMRLSSIWLPDSVTEIGDWGFDTCVMLQSITLPAGLQTIRDHAFSRCESLPGIQLPDNVTEIGNAAFYYCPALREITLPNKLERIGDQAFSWCSMQSVYIPASVTYIGNSAFSICLELTNIYTTSASVEFGGNPIVNCPVLSSITGPLAGSDQRSIIVDNTLISIASYGLTRYVVPEGITDIGESAFSGMTLSEVTLPATLESIGKKAFSRTSLQSVVIPDGVKSIGADAFDSCPLTEVTIPASVTKLEPTAFERCEQLSRVEILAESVDFHASATNTVGNPFAFCTALAKITGPMVNEDHRTIVVDETLIAVAAAGLTHYDVPDGVVCVAKDAVASSTLEGVTLPSSITEIGNRAFRACSALSSVSLPASLVSVGTIVFPRSLTDLSVLAETPPDIVVRSFDGNYPIYVPAESLEAYRTAPIWKDHYLDRLRSISSEPGGQEGIGYENW